MWETLIAAGILILAVLFGGIWVFREVKGKGCCTSCGDPNVCGHPQKDSKGGCSAKEPR